MRTATEKLQQLKPNSVWVFTKQETDFDESYKSALLFSEIPDKENTNIEDYFTKNHTRYDIQTDRHRILVIPQFFGMITKTPFYERGGTYNDENPTAIFDIIKAVSLQSKEYNTLKTEQVLKLKIHAIIDTANNNQGYNILPVLFIYKVLRGLKEKYGITKITIDQLYTYVMTCESYSEVDEAIEFIRLDSPISEFVADFKSRSRVLTCVKKNTNLFSIDSQYISINPAFDDYFYNNFILKYDFEELHEQLLRDVDYSYFLYNHQKFNINLIDEPETAGGAVSSTVIPVSSFIDEEDETAYIEKVDSIKETNINEKAGEGAHTVEPVAVSKFDVGRRFRTNPLLGKIAIKKAYYSCEKDYQHETFISKKTQQKYMEAHHLIPVCFQKEVWDKYHINIDCVENLVSLCPTCHKAIHYGTKEVQRKMITELFTRCAPKYKAIGLNITLEEIFKFYKI
ncbi:MAG: HNH endonuclease [Clostridiales bacterium]|nr:HNH endonuclease [Clostridiales bacterium]